MARIAGVQFEKDSKGRKKKVTIDLKKWGEYLEDFFDMLEIEMARDEETVPWEKVKKELIKKKKINLLTHEL